MTRNHWLLGTFLLIAGAGTGCTTTVEVAVPPRVDLGQYDRIGLIQFASNSGDPIERLGTQKFLQSVQTAQPGTPILELGTDQQVLASINHKQWSTEAIRTIGEDHGVDAVVIGRIDLDEAKPNIELTSLLKTLSARADVEVSLSTRLLETAGGATVWTNSATATSTVARADLTKKGAGILGVTDPDAVYGGLVEGLVHDITDDFRVHYEQREVPNK